MSITRTCRKKAFESHLSSRESYFESYRTFSGFLGGVPGSAENDTEINTADDTAIRLGGVSRPR